MASVRVVSELPGKVFEIDVAEGNTVSQDDTLVTLESMKMEIPIVSPVSGVVKQILVALGDSVEEGQDIAVIET